MDAAEHAQPLYPQAELRSPDTVMKLDRMGAFFPTRLSFMRSTIRRLAAEKAEVKRALWQMDDEGYGRAVYTLDYGGHTYSLVAFSNRIPDDMRTDRVIAEVWDSAYVLYDGIPDEAELDRLQANAPRQEAGRFLPCDLVLSRANKSLRLFEHVAASLAAGRQPDAGMIGEIGYLMRTTAVYGNGKFGIADRARISGRPGMAGPFQAEMLTVWLIRTFTHDLVEHVANMRAPEAAVPLARHLKRHLGIGNSTGLGMAPFLVSHPVLLNNWMLVRETALARVRAVEALDKPARDRFFQLADRVRHHLNEWNVQDERQNERVKTLRDEWKEVAAEMTSALAKKMPIEALLALGEGRSLECQELLVALALEPFAELVDGLTDCMASDVEPCIDPAMSVGELTALLRQTYAWALDLEVDEKPNCRRFWYVSEEKLEPRLGDRFAEEGAERELPHDIAKKAKALLSDLEKAEAGESTARFLMRHPEHRYVTKRVQTLKHRPYAEIRDNLVGEACLPIDMLRCKLSFFGASKFDPKSDRWTRITLYQGAPLTDETSAPAFQADDWWLPVMDAHEVNMPT